MATNFKVGDMVGLHPLEYSEVGLHPLEYRETFDYKGHIGTVAGYYDIGAYPTIVTVVLSDEFQKVFLRGWSWDMYHTVDETHHLHSMCAGNVVYNFHQDDLRPWKTKKGNVL